MSVKIIVAAHKKYSMPHDDIYLPLQVGAKGKDDLGYQRDDTGDNISEKNPFFCELTGLYWAWKNLDCDYLGLVHYRRYFSFSKHRDIDNVLHENEVVDLLKKYKCILPKKQKYYIETLYSHYKHTHYIDTLDNAVSIVDILYPAYTPVLQKTLKQTSGYMFNMFIMSKEMSDAYCEWLFPILFELEKVTKENDYSSFQSRFYGRISEILFNAWINYQLQNGRIMKKDITTIGVCYMEKVNWTRKIICFLKAKFLHKKYEKSF